MTFKNMNDLLNYIQQDVQSTLETDVADAVKDNMSKSVNTSVYDTYEPLQYNRRYEHGGLSDKYNMQTIHTKDGIAVKNITPLDNGGTVPPLDEIIVLGKGRQPFARDFYEDTVERLENNGEHVAAMKNGLRKRGYKVK